MRLNLDFLQYETSGLPKPEIVVFQSWTPNPTHVLPESDPRTMTGGLSFAGSLLDKVHTNPANSSRVTPSIHAAAAGKVMRVNVPGIEKMSEAQQDALIDQLLQLQYGVKTVRTGISEKFTRFVIRAYERSKRKKRNGLHFWLLIFF